jgi:hypothetical protein
MYPLELCRKEIYMEKAKDPQPQVELSDDMLKAAAGGATFPQKYYKSKAEVDMDQKTMKPEDYTGKPDTSL